MIMGWDGVKLYPALVLAALFIHFGQYHGEGDAFFRTDVFKLHIKLYNTSE